MISGLGLNMQTSITFLNTRSEYYSNKIEKKDDNCREIVERQIEQQI